MSTGRRSAEFRAWLLEVDLLRDRKRLVPLTGREANLMEQAWQASRAALVVELPDPHQTAKRYMADEAKFAHKEGIDECRAALDAAGARVKP